MSKRPSTFLLRQKQFLKLSAITYIEQERYYASEILQLLKKEYSEFGYKPSHTEVYKALNELVEEGMLERHARKQGEDYQYKEVVTYSLIDRTAAANYKKKTHELLVNSKKMIQKIIKNNF
ncbi:helix-turn-helix transcriptional regulator [Bacillus altitudinis]|uniref:helix-turn-helix transcriptional regulator n=1 Tax=Bacillus TaxID=1386 RepID=UPI000260A9AE|nr:MULTISPECIES: helix-turn-helix transcriptional regulator [Bacillus]EIL83355.1 hypothetical protein BAME_34190 [Bacillus sp. M 2-6]MEC0473675.1 helix-turn-helix transcriptional regulator [Bacillus altitudinis]